MWIAIGNAIGSRQPVGGGAPPDPGYTPPLDTYTGATAAYSVRKLSSSYSGPCIEAYRVSDGATQDIGFDADGLIDTAAIVAFASGSEVRVRTWYDQSGNTLDAVQTTPSQMPQIYDGSAVITFNDAPAILWNGTNQTYLQTGLYDAWSDGSSFTTMVFNGRQGPAGSHTYWDIETGVQRYSSGVGNMFALFYGTSQVGVSTNIAPTTQGIHTWYSVASETNAAVYIDGALKGSNTRTNPVGDTNVSAYIGSRVGGSQWNSSHYQEIIHWGSDVVSIRTGLEANLNSYFQIANLPATTGFLADYPGAAAAYSVRSLSNNATKCMRVRRTVAPFDEQDIGFDSNGDLDTAAIATFGGSDALTVSTWYDQSGSTNHASQGTASSQPQIYDGAAVITENGKPALDFDGSDDFLGATGAIWSRLACAAVMYIDVPDDSVALQYGQPNTRFMLGVGGKASANKIGSQVYDGAFFGADGADITDGQYLVYNDASISPDTNEMYLDGAAVSQAYETRSGLPSTATYTIGCRGNNAYHFLGKFQEITIWTSDQDSNRTGIESNINTYFSIY